jgi:GTP cyclohydrolase I
MNAILATEQRLVALADAPNLPAGNAAPPVSARIRARLQRAKRRFHANDNISPFVAPGEMEELLDEVEGKMKEVLQSLVIDTGSDHNTQDTARRVAKMYLSECPFRGHR